MRLRSIHDLRTARLQAWAAWINAEPTDTQARRVFQEADDRLSQAERARRSGFVEASLTRAILPLVTKRLRDWLSRVETFRVRFFVDELLAPMWAADAARDELLFRSTLCGEDV